MTRNQALRLAIMAINKQAHVIAYDANAYARGIGMPSQKKRAEEYKQYMEAIKMLENMMRQKEMDL